MISRHYEHKLIILRWHLTLALPTFPARIVLGTVAPRMWKPDGQSEDTAQGAFPTPNSGGIMLLFTFLPNYINTSIMAIDKVLLAFWIQWMVTKANDIYDG